MKKLLVILLLLNIFSSSALDQKNQIQARLKQSKELTSPKIDACDKCITTTNNVLCCLPRCCYWTYILCCKTSI